MTAFKNKHLSYSRLSRYEDCPLSFKRSYIDGECGDAGFAAKFGQTLHAVFEALMREHVTAEQVVSLSEVRALELLQDQWTRHELVGAQAYQEAVDIVRSFVRDEGMVDPADVLGIEQPFEIQVGRFRVVGAIDRVDRLEDDGVLVRDYKSWRLVPEREELDANLQLSLYNVAARKLYPWAKRVALELHLVRHGVRLVTYRSDEQLETAMAYAASLGEQTESATTFAPRLNKYCGYCAHRSTCPAYAQALAGHREFACDDLSNLDAVAAEREEVAVLSKILYARKNELDDVLKMELEVRGEMVLGGLKYRLFNNARRDFPVAATLKKLSEATGQSEAALLDRLGSLENKRVDALLKSIGSKLGKSKASLLKLELDALAEKTVSSRLWATRAA